MANFLVGNGDYGPNSSCPFEVKFGPALLKSNLVQLKENWFQTEKLAVF